MTDLTPEQEALIPAHREKWRKIGTSTSKTNEERCTLAWERMYEIKGYDKPTVRYYDSPDACLQAIAKHLGKPPGQTPENYVSTWCTGSFDAYWCCFYEFGEMLGEEYPEQDHFDAYKVYVEEANYAYPLEDGNVFVSRKPVEINFDEDDRLHCEDGPAIQYADGYTVCMWHGMRIPREWILDKNALTADIALTYHNVELRRAACEILGWHNVLKELNAKTIDKDKNPLIGTLLEVELPMEDGVKDTERFLQVECGTGRTFALPVPRVCEATGDPIDTAFRAQKWLNWCEDEDDVVPSIRT